MGYEYEETKTIVEIGQDGQSRPARIEKVKKHVQPNVTAQIFWLKNRKPQQWRDVQKIEHSGGLNNANMDLTQVPDDEIDKELAKLEHIEQARKRT